MFNLVFKDDSEAGVQWFTVAYQSRKMVLDEQQKINGICNLLHQPGADAPQPQDLFSLKEARTGLRCQQLNLRCCCAALHAINANS
jgi:hypothetical protein